ncbi:MAG: pentapeptide repeat-containing protein [Campylobacter sp.]
MTSSSKTSDIFNLANKKLKEIFGNDKVSECDLIGINGIDQTHIVKEIDTINNEDLQDILEKHNIKFQNCEFGFLNINDFKNIEFNNCKIEMFDSNISDTNIKEKLVFTKCIFYSKSYNVDFAPTNFKNVTFEECIFKSNINIKDAKFQNFTFKECTVFGDFIASDCIFENANFKNNKFYGFTNFKNTIFKDNVYFNNSEFKKFTDFHECEFKKLASFYGVRFYKTPNFSSVNFVEKPILINIKFDSHSFSSIKQDCDDEIKRRLENNKETTEAEIYQKVYSDFRNSFSILKHTLNQNGNLIDASNHHKAELYCKEMGLDYEIENDEKLRVNFNKNINSFEKRNVNYLYSKILLILFAIIMVASLLILKLYKEFDFLESIVYSLVGGITLYGAYIVVAGFIYSIFNIKYFINLINITLLKMKLPNITKWVEALQLYIYRKTSDHHTNLNKIFHFTLLMIVSYWSCLFCINTIGEIGLNETMYFCLNLITLALLIFIPMLNSKKISDIGTLVITFLFTIFIATIFILPNISYVTFSVLLYMLILSFAYFIFTRSNNPAIILTKTLTYAGFIIVLLKNPELINPTLNIFNKENIENIENKILSEKLAKLDYKDLANLTRLSFGDYDIDTNITFLESNIVNQKELIIANKATLENVLGLLFRKNKKEELDKILKNLPNKGDLNATLKEPKNRGIALDLIFAANKIYKRNLYDMEINDKFRLKFDLADKKEIQKEIDLVINDLTKIQDVLQKLSLIVEKQKIYLDIYEAIRIDEINSRTYKSTYILYVIVIILCLYSLTKTARKNSLVS